jgi:hypothetical protein
MTIKISDHSALNGTLSISRDGIGLGFVYLPMNEIGRVAETGQFEAAPFNPVREWRTFDTREAAIAYLVE